MAKTFEQLVQELGARIDGAFLATATSGSKTTLVDSNLLARWPNSISNGMNQWVYGPNEADSGNKGQECRAVSWDSGAQTLTLYAPGFASNIATGTYEIHPRIKRDRKAAAINAAVGQLGLIYWRDFVDESITTVLPTDGGIVGTNGWKYNLTSLLTNGPYIARITRIELQIGISSLLTSAGFPYASATIWNPDVYKDVDASGNETWWLQFGMLPPPGRKLRIHGEAYATQLVADTDKLPLSGQYEGDALEWIYDYAQYVLNAADAAKLSQPDSQRWRQAEFDRLQTAKERLLLAAPTHANSPIAVPGKGDGLYDSSLRNDSSWLGSFRSLH